LVAATERVCHQAQHAPLLRAVLEDLHAARHGAAGRQQGFHLVGVDGLRHTGGGERRWERRDVGPARVHACRARQGAAAPGPGPPRERRRLVPSQAPRHGGDRAPRDRGQQVGHAQEDLKQLVRRRGSAQGRRQRIKERADAKLPHQRLEFPVRQLWQEDAGEDQGVEALAQGHSLEGHQSSLAAKVVGYQAMAADEGGQLGELLLVQRPALPPAGAGRRVGAQHQCGLARPGHITGGGGRYGDVARRVRPAGGHLDGHQDIGSGHAGTCLARDQLGAGGGTWRGGALKYSRWSGCSGCCVIPAAARMLYDVFAVAPQPGGNGR
jgi:hypothetical protein